MDHTDDRKRPSALNLTPIRSTSSGSSTSTVSSLGKALRTPRFAEATSIHSPIEPAGSGNRNMAAPSQPGDIGFGYINNDQDSAAPPVSPRLKSALKVPGTPGRALNPLSPTFREEQILEKRELSTDDEQQKDFRIKARVRLAKVALRSVNFSCSLIVLSMLSSSFAIFNATKSLPTQNNLPAWASNTNIWPQCLVLAASCLSLLICVLVFIGYCRGGHKRAEKVGVYYTLFAVGWFIVSMVMWVLAIGVLQHAKNNSSNKDMWGWACVDNTRHDLFAKQVDYSLVCRLQNWSLICMIIEVVIEVISITLYSVVFYRYYTKRRLMKSMDMRDKARSDLYLAQLRSQSAPNTPGFGPKSPGFASVYGPKSPGMYSQHMLSPRLPPTAAYRSMGDVEVASPFTPGGRHIPEPTSNFSPQIQIQKPEKPFKLQAPPPKARNATPKTSNKASFSPVEGPSPVSPVSTSSFTTPNSFPMTNIHAQGHAPVASDEPVYDAVPIPGAYAGQAVKNPPPR